MPIKRQNSTRQFSFLLQTHWKSLLRHFSIPIPTANHGEPTCPKHSPSTKRHKPFWAPWFFDPKHIKSCIITEFCLEPVNKSHALHLAKWNNESWCINSCDGDKKTPMETHSAQSMQEPTHCCQNPCPPGLLCLPMLRATLPMLPLWCYYTSKTRWQNSSKTAYMPCLPI